MTAGSIADSIGWSVCTQHPDATMSCWLWCPLVANTATRGDRIHFIGYVITKQKQKLCCVSWSLKTDLQEVCYLLIKESHGIIYVLSIYFSSII